MISSQRAIIYTRISQDRTGNEQAVTRQEEECRRLTDYKRWQVVAVESDSISASSGKKRPGWERVLEMVRAGEADVIVAYHLDRITRTMVDLEELILMAEQTGVGVSTATGDIDLTNDVGRMVSRILAAVARQEVERKAARQKAANKQRAASGEMWRSGWRAFGYDGEGKPIKKEADAIRAAVRDFLAGQAEITDIATRWTQAGLKPTSGRDGAWNLPTVRNILRNPKYAGLRDYDGTEYEGVWKPIITKQQHYEAKSKLDDPARRSGGNPGGRHPINLLTSIAVCKNGHPMRSAVVNKRPVYQCRQGCVTITKADADTLVLSSLAMSLSVMRPGTVLPAYSGADSGALELARDGLRSRLADASRSYTSGSLSLPQFESVSSAIEAELQALEEKLSSLSTVPVEEIKRNALDRFQGMTLKQQRAMLADLQTELVILSPGRGRRNVNARELMLMSVTTLTDGVREPRRIVVLDGPHKKAPETLAHIDEILSEAE